VLIKKLTKMELTEVFTGSRRRRNLKTAQSRVKSGPTLLAMSVTGAITAKKASEFSTIRMVINTKACGLSTRNTDREPSGESITESYEENTLVTGTRIADMDVELSSIQMAIVTTDTGLMDPLKEKAV